MGHPVRYPSIGALEVHERGTGSCVGLLLRTDSHGGVSTQGVSVPRQY
jgi:hypothetical protein